MAGGGGRALAAVAGLTGRPRERHRQSLASRAAPEISVVDHGQRGRKLVALVSDQLDLGPTNRLKALLGDGWSACRDALRAAAMVGELGVLIGPVAATLNGAPQRPGDGRVDVLIAAGNRERVAERLLQHGAYPDGIEQAAAGPRSERRERWEAGRGLLTIRARAAGVNDISTVRDRALSAMLNQDDAGLVRIALVEHLAAIAAVSPWSEDALYLPGLRAVLASGRYSSRRPPEEQLQLA